MTLIFDSKLSVEKNSQLARLIEKSRKALAQLKSDDVAWDGEGYSPRNEEEIAELEAALEPFKGMY